MRKIEFKGKMPDPFRKEAGTRMTPLEWKEKRNEIRNMVVDVEFGGMPPRPEYVDFELINFGGNATSPAWYRVKAGKKDKYLTFNLAIKRNREEGVKHPVFLTGDGCFLNLENDTINEACNRGYAIAWFNRLDFANDTFKLTDRLGPLYEIYPEYPEFSAMSAWAWGYSVCMDVFEKLDYIDETEVGITGHSRGGKTVLLAATVDERIKYVCPNSSGTHGANSYRCIVTEQGEKGASSERLSYMMEKIPTWMGPKLREYIDNEDKLPYDMHYFGALIAPRYYLQIEGLQDYWINPIGAWQNFCAVKECYKYLGCENNAGAWYKPGGHKQKYDEFKEFMDFMDRARAGLPLAEHLQVNPYPEIEKNFDW